MSFTTQSVGTPFSKLKSPRKNKLKFFAEGEVTAIKYIPEATRQMSNGWQLKCDTMKSRIAHLFNNHTLADVIFHLDMHRIPAHRFVLASASSIFYKQLCDEDGRPVSMRASDLSAASLAAFLSGGQGQTVLSISDVPHLAFFEFLQFIYTDQVSLTLDNVWDLILLADTYRVAGLSDKCFEHLRAEVVPVNVLRVLAILQTMMMKACMTCWRELIEQKKDIAKLREMTLAERRQRVQELQDSSTAGSRRVSNAASVVFGRRVSNASRRSSKTSNSARRSSRTAGIGRRQSHRSSCGGGRSARSSVTYGNYDSEDGATEEMDSDEEFLLNHGISFKKHSDTAFRGRMIDVKITSFVEELTSRCWKCISEETDAVLACPDFADQSHRMIQRILNQSQASVPEISLFRAVCCWAEKECKRQGLEPSALNQRAVLGPATIHLIRFAAMTVEQFEWEVVPTGILPHQDVQQLLYSMGRRGAIHNYEATPRTNMALLKCQRNKGNEEEEGLTDSDDDPEARYVALSNLRLYSPEPGDSLEAMLGSELLRGALKKRSESAIDDKLLEQGSRPPSSVDKLPALTPRPTSTPLASTRAPSTRPPSTTPGSPSLEALGIADGAASRAPSRSESATPMPSLWRTVASESPGTMVMGARHDDGQADEALAGGGGRLPEPEDFDRIVEGIYRFRGESLVEMWLENGEAMVRDHGPLPRMALSTGSELREANAAVARRLLGLQSTPLFGSGVPLQSFLCRQ